MTRVAVVTGRARGIGAATVEALVEEGWAVVAVDRCADDPRLPYGLATEEELRDVVERAGGADRVVPIVADASDAAAMTGAVQSAEERFGGLDAMVAIAGVIAGGVPLWEMPQEQQEAVLEVNLLLRRQGWRHRPRPRPRRGAARHGRDRECRQPRLDRDRDPR